MVALSPFTTTSTQNSTLGKSRARYLESAVFSNGIAEQRMLPTER
jgi:hypothetical protein